LDQILKGEFFGDCSFYTLTGSSGPRAVGDEPLGVLRQGFAADSNNEGLDVGDNMFFSRFFLVIAGLFSVRLANHTNAQAPGVPLVAKHIDEREMQSELAELHLHLDLQFPDAGKAQMQTIRRRLACSQSRGR
jgi:hypothetical protein